MSDSKILETKGIIKRFDGLVAVNDISIEVAMKERVGIIGPNGAGKTTFFNLLTGLFTPEEGKILYHGDGVKDITHMPPYKRVDLGFIRTFQLVSVFNSLTVLENLVLGIIRFNENYHSKRKFFLKNIAQPEIVEKCLDALRTMGIEDKAELQTNELSYGDKRKLEIAIALSLNPKVLLLDEPFAGLSDGEIDEVLGLINRISVNFALIIIEHKISRIIDLVQKLNVMHEGRLIASGEPNEVLCDSVVREIYWGKEGVLECS